jgi:hypothetical protein
MRKLGGALLVALIVTGSASAQDANWRFRWQQGQTIYYRVEHTTCVAEVVGGNKVETKSKLNLVRAWKVTAAGPDGSATLAMSITAMRNEQTRPNGEVLVFDSREPDKSTPALREQLSKMIGQTLVELRIDSLGRVLEVKQGQASRFEAELPFAVQLPGTAVAVGQSWNRQYAIVLDPPLGTGEKYPAAQNYVCTKVEGGLATLTMTTALAKMPDNKAEQLPLLQKLPQGEIVFDTQHGRLSAVRVTIEREVQGHQGEGSSYHFQSTYKEQYAE